MGDNGGFDPMLSGPNVWPVLVQGTFVSEAKCQAVLGEAVPRTLPEQMRIAWETGELKHICIRVREPAAAAN